MEVKKGFEKEKNTCLSDLPYGSCFILGNDKPVGLRGKVYMKIDAASITPKYCVIDIDTGVLKTEIRGDMFVTPVKSVCSVYEVGK